MVDLVQDLNRDLLFLQRRPGQLHELALEKVARREKEKHKEEDERGLAAECDETGGAPRNVLPDIDRRLLNLHARDVFGGGIRSGGLIRSLLQLLGSLLHLADSAVVAVPLHRAT